MFPLIEPAELAISARAKAIFSYTNVVGNKTLEDDPNPLSTNFFSRHDPKKVFIDFSYIGERFAPAAEHAKQKGGWKLHIAVDDRAPGNLVLAWNLIKDILIDYRLAQSKIIKPEVSFMSDPLQCGKQITIYQYYNPDRDWNRVINDIERTLRHNNVAPGAFSPTDAPISHSLYIAYRNDLNRLGKDTIDAREAMRYPPETRYNPFNHQPNPFNGIVVLP